MHKNIIIKPGATQSIQNYITRYGFYYQDLYEDSGLWNEDMIIKWRSKMLQVQFVDEGNNRIVLSINIS